MSRVLFRRLIVIVICSAAASTAWAATKVAVGPPTCQPSLVHFSSIQAAVNSVPFGTIINVCPGNYSEQVVISQPLTLKGITDGTGNSAVISVPGAGLVANANSAEFGTVSAQLLVQNTVGVTISDLIVDGTGSNCPAGANRSVGIEFYNVGTPSDGVLAGKIQNVVVRNQRSACGGGEGILSDTSYITITTNAVREVDRTGILADRARNSIINNTVQNSNNYGIILDAASSSLVSGNTVSNSTNNAGILVEDATQSATITKNTVVNANNAGIWLYFAYYTTVTSNTVASSGWPMVLQFCFNDTIQSNILNSAANDGILDTNSYGGNKLLHNTVNEAAFGIFTDSTASADTLVPNNLFNVIVTIDPNPPTFPGTPDNP